MWDYMEARARAVSYRLLSECYYPPAESLLHTLQAHANNSDSVNFALPSSAVEIADLQKDYARLFLGPFEILVPLYGSVYLEEEDRVYGDSTLDAQRRYEEDGLQVVLQEPPDHVAVELEYAYLLAHREAELLEGGQPVQAGECRNRLADFLQSHLAVWLPAFAQRVAERAETDFYRQLASITDAYIRKESELLLSLDEVAEKVC